MSDDFGVPEPANLSDLSSADETPVAETSVRLALPAEANEIGEIQVAAWRTAYAGLLPADVLADLNPAQFAAQWRAALIAPGEARNRVMVALAGRTLVGFAAITPSDDPDADPQRDALIAELAVKPDATRAGHGSRLLNAVVDTVRADGFGRVTVWVNSTDDVLRAFYTEGRLGPRRRPPRARPVRRRVRPHQADPPAHRPRFSRLTSARPHILRRSGASSSADPQASTSSAIARAATAVRRCSTRAGHPRPRQAERTQADSARPPRVVAGLATSAPTSAARSW